MSFLWRYLLFLLCLTGAAVNTGNNLLYLVLSFMIAFAVAAFAATGRSLGKTSATLILPDEVEAGRAFVLGIEARSAERRFPIGGSDVSLAGFPGDAPGTSLPSLPPDGHAVVSVTARAARRGVYTDLGVTLRTSYPFGLFRRRRMIRTPGALVVTPRRRRLRSLAIEAPVSEGSRSSRRAGDGAELFNIRDYTTQDDARRIDWKASARVGRPMLREFERDQERTLDVMLDERVTGNAWQAPFEDLVEKAASILGYCDEMGIQGRLLVTDAGGIARPLAGRASSRYLATVRGSADAPTPDPGAGSGGPRIVLSLDAAVRTRVHLEPYDARGGGDTRAGGERRA